nr:PREDICTED: protein jagged-1b-like [Bemisia tabaci]
MHGGHCQDFVSRLNCMCPVDYESIESQYEFDACRADVCKNGPPCVDNCPGYKCICPRPFTGKNFNEYRVDCHENSSPPTATCVNSTGRFYCQCPFNLTGDDSRRTIQVDYHLSFPESQASSAVLSVPFRISGITTFTIPMWAQFSHRNEPGVFFTLYSVTSDHRASLSNLIQLEFRFLSSLKFKMYL